VLLGSFFRLALEDGAGFLFFFGLLIILEDGTAISATIFVNVAQKLDDGDLTVA